MAEDAGKLEVEYVVISDAAVRRLERLQKQMDKVEDSAVKQGKSMQEAYKKAGKTLAAFGAVVVGMLYGIIRASSYASMWMDQISHQMTRIATKILEITGMDEVITAFIASLKNLADELENPEENDFWKNMGEIWDGMSIKAKILTGLLIALFGALSLLTVAGIASGLISLAVKLGFLAKGTTLLTASAKVAAFAMKVLGAAFAFVTSPIGLIIIAVALIAAAFLYLWSKTEIGKATIQSLINIWNNFKDDIAEVGWLKAVLNAITGLDHTIKVAIIKTIKMVLLKIIELSGKIKAYVLRVGGEIIDKLVAGVRNGLKRLAEGLVYIYNNFWDILSDVKTLAIAMGGKIIEALVAGLKGASGYIKDYLNGLVNIWNEDMDVLAVEAHDNGKTTVESLADGMLDRMPETNAAGLDVGEGIYDGIETGVNGAHLAACEEMVGMVDCVAVGVDAVNEELDRIITDIQIKANVAMAAGEYVAGGWGWSLSGWKAGGNDGGGGDYVASGSGWSAGWMNSATGGHVDRTGTAVVHQGEDIINLQRLLGNIDSGNAVSRGDIIINPTINISSNGKMSDPFEANRVSELISKRMGEELRRITTNI